MNYLKPLITLALTCAITTAHAQSPLNIVSEPTVAVPPKDVIIKELGWMDKNKMEQEITELSELTQTKIGTPIRKNLSDLDTMQRLIDKNRAR